MANKSLSQVVGAGGVEIGDIIKTKATVLTDGKVLLPCDGSTLTPASYPQLEALLGTGKAYSFPAIYGSSDGTTLNSTGSVLFGQRSAINDAGTKICTIDDDADIWYQDASGAAEVATPTGSVCNAVMSDDGNEVLIGNTNSGTADLIAYYSTSGGAPSSTVNIETTDSMNNACVATCMNNAGTSALVIATNGTDSTLDTYISGANIGTGYTLQNAYSFTTSPNQPPIDVCWTEDLQAIALLNPNSITDGIWLTTNQGLTWTEQISLTGYDFYSIALDQSDNLYAISSTYDTIFKTADAGTTWTEFLTVHDVIPFISDWDAGGMSISFSTMKVDRSDNWYVLLSLFGGGDGLNGIMLHQLGLLYSGDQGTTWVYTTLAKASALGGGVSPEYWLPVAGVSGVEFSLSQNGTSILATISSTTVSNARRMTSGTTGAVLPLLPGYKIVADAP